MSLWIRSKTAYVVTGYLKTKGGDRLLSTSIHTFLVGEGKGKGSNEGNKIQGYFRGRVISVGGKRRKKK